MIKYIIQFDSKSMPVEEIRAVMKYINDICADEKCLFIPQGVIFQEYRLEDIIRMRNHLNEIIDKAAVEKQK